MGDPGNKYWHNEPNLYSQPTQAQYKEWVMDKIPKCALKYTPG